MLSVPRNRESNVDYARLGPHGRAMRNFRSIFNYNCRGLRKAELADIIVKCDVLLLQETWLAKQELELLNDLHEDYSGFGTAKCDYAQARTQGGFVGCERTPL